MRRVSALSTDYGVWKESYGTKFGVPSFSHFVNIEVEPQKFEELP